MTWYLRERPAWDEAELPSLLDELSLWSSYFGALLLEHLPLRRGLRVLDLGCGAGFPLLELADRLGPSGRAFGLDPWAPALARARWKADRRGLGRVFIVRGDGARMPFAEGSFDLVVSNLGVNNFEDPAAVLAECGRVARAGGRLALTTNPAGHFREFYAVFESVLREMGLEGRLPALELQEAHRLSPERIESLLVAAGFASPRRVERRFCFRYADADALFGHFLTRIGFLDGWRSVLEGAGEEGAVFSRLEASLEREAAAKGALTMTVPAVYMEAERR